MWRILTVVTMTVVFLLGQHTSVQSATIDNPIDYVPPNLITERPAATLLLPYFEVDLANPNGTNTVFTINSGTATATLAHVTIWSDLGVPVLAFNVYLTGYDVQRVDLRNIIQLGLLPTTASAGQDPSDTRSPKGIFSQDINFASCTGQLPLPPLSSVYIQHLQTSLSGKPSALFGLCAGTDKGSRAVGYVTVDTVNNCTLRVAGQPGYFQGDVTNQNVLWGDYAYIRPDLLNGTTGISRGGALVHIRANNSQIINPTPPPFQITDPNFEAFVPGDYTFYGRYVNWQATDNRQPLSTNFASRYIGGSLFSTGTSLVVWRDSKVNQDYFPCPAIPSARPAWFPLGQEEIVIFDEQEHPTSLTSSFPFPTSTQRVKVGGPTLPVPVPSGWLYLNLNQSNAVAGNNPADPAAAQAWVNVIQDVDGRFNLATSATQLDSATSANHTIVNP